MDPDSGRRGTVARLPKLRPRIMGDFFRVEAEGGARASRAPGRTAMDFMIVAVSAVLGAASPTPASPPAAAPQMQRHFTDELTCEQAAKAVEAPPGTRLVCIPTSAGGVHTAH